MSKQKPFSGPVPYDLVQAFLETRLRPLLPYSLPLYRRGQCHLRETADKVQTCTDPESLDRAEIWVAVDGREHGSTHDLCTTALIKEWVSNTESEHVSPELRQQVDLNGFGHQQDWIAVYIDLTNQGETQIWLFASWEAQRSLQLDTTEVTRIKDARRVALFQALYARLRLVHIPRLPVTPPRRWQSILETGKLITVPYKRSKILFGGIIEDLCIYLEDDVVRHPDLASTQAAHTDASDKDKIRLAAPSNLRRNFAREDLSYLKFLIDVNVEQVAAPTKTTPPPGFRFGPLSEAHMQTMLDRTVIPRTMELLRSLVSVGLFVSGAASSPVMTSQAEEDKNNSKNSNEDQGRDAVHEEAPIAWGLLSKDASISSLHTEPEYRGQGLAEHITKELIRLQVLQDEGLLQWDRRKGEQTKSNWMPRIKPKPPSLTSHDEPQVQLQARHHQNDLHPSQPQPQQIHTQTAVRYAHTDVSSSNTSSQRVFEKMGARVGWKVGWIEIDVGETPSFSPPPA